MITQCCCCFAKGINSGASVVLHWCFSGASLASKQPLPPLHQLGLLMCFACLGQRAPKIAAAALAKCGLGWAGQWLNLAAQAWLKARAEVCHLSWMPKPAQLSSPAACSCERCSMLPPCSRQVSGRFLKCAGLARWRHGAHAAMAPAARLDCAAARIATEEVRALAVEWQEAPACGLTRSGATLPC